jgi:hypothetical protein
VIIVEPIEVPDIEQPALEPVEEPATVPADD